MKHTKEEILNALHVIKETCEEYDDCEDGCPFERNEDCLIQFSYPGAWKINDGSPETWRGLL